MSDTDERHSQWHIDRFRTMAADGAELAGEARFATWGLGAGSAPRMLVREQGYVVG